MEKRIEIFRNSNPYDLETQVNIFLERAIGKLHDVLFEAFYNAETPEYLALIVYTPEEESCEKENQNTKENEKSYARIQGGRVALREQKGSCGNVALASCCDWVK